MEIENYEQNREGIPATYVPFRNTHLLSIATSWAEVIGACSIFIGVVEQDSSGYPDCRTAYFEAFNQLIEKGTKPETHIVIETPLIHLRKKDIVLKGTQLNAPLHLTWSCYRSTGKACGTCDSCKLRLKGFEEAGLKDPILYK
jgi:7-cyano-7-deazaguanine synthase